MNSRSCIAVLALACAPLAHAADESGQFCGLLRSRDLSPFGFLRLDMRPAHAVAIEPGSWALEDGRIAGWKHKTSGSAVVARYLPFAYRNNVDPDLMARARTFSAAR